MNGDALPPLEQPAGQAASPPVSNVIELSVGELSGALKRTIEDRFGFVRVRGEISNYRGPHSSGHAYFCLKDEMARIDAVVWRTAFARLKTKPQEGLEVVATGRVTTFPGKSTYQIVIESIEPAGIGALMAILEARRKALAGEGLFDEGRKRPLPFLPRIIGVVTSPTGSVIRDILHRIEDRFPRHLLVWPVRVQGETAAAEVAAAIAGFDALSAAGPIPRPDVLIVARGGGSLEDLWAFNEEVVIRAAAACSIPLVAAVGHETDWTLIDHVADLRAPTPSGAAEKAVPVRTDLLIQAADLGRRHLAGLLRVVSQRRNELRALARALPGAESIMLGPRQRLDRAETRRAGAVTAIRDRRRLELARLAHRLAGHAPRARLAQEGHALAAFEQRMIATLRRDGEQRHLGLVRLAHRLSTQTPRARFDHKRHQLTVLGQRLGFHLHRDAERRRRNLGQSTQRLASASLALRRDLQRAGDMHARTRSALTRLWAAGLETRRARVAGFSQLLGSLGYKQVLARGFALVRDAEGHPVRSVAQAAPAMPLDIEFADGHIEAIVGSHGDVTAKMPAQALSVQKARSAQKARGETQKPRGARLKIEQGSLF